MKSSRSKDIFENDSFLELLRKALEKHIEDMDLPSDSELENVTFSEVFEKRMEKFFRNLMINEKTSAIPKKSGIVLNFDKNQKK